jgi:hypothetical protein
MNIQLTLAARHLWGRKTRTFLTTLAVVFGVMVIFGLNGLLPTMMTAFRQNMLAAAGKVDLTVTSVTSGSFEAGVPGCWKRCAVRQASRGPQSRCGATSCCLRPRQLAR